MSGPAENPFASPAIVSPTECERFYVFDKDIAAREILQAFVAGALTLLFVVMWLLMLVSAPPAPVLIHILWLFFVASCLATTLNHRGRARRAWERLPLLLDETRLSAKFREGDSWVQHEIPWGQITSVRLEPKGKMVVNTTYAAQHLADCSPIGAKRLIQLEKCLKRYSDLMAPEEAK